MQELKLTLSGKWYDMIEANIKKEEYREISVYWIKRLFDIADRKDLTYSLYPCNKEQAERLYPHFKRTGITLHNDYIIFPRHRIVRFYRAVPYFSPRAKNMAYETTGVAIGKGKAEWGGNDENTFIIRLGNRLDKF